MVILYPIALVVIALMFVASLATWGSSSAVTPPKGLPSVAAGSTSQTTAPSSSSTTAPAASTTTPSTTAPSTTPTTLLQNGTGGTTGVPLAAVQLAEASVANQFVSSMTVQVATFSASQATLNISGTNTSGAQVVTSVVVVNKNGQWEIATGG